MKKWQSPIGVSLAAAVLLLGAPSISFAQTGGQVQAPRNTPTGDQQAQMDAISKKLAAEGVTDVTLSPEKHGYKGTGMKNGKKVKIEVNERGQWEIK